MSPSLEQRLNEAFREADRLLSPFGDRTQLLRRFLAAEKQRAGELMSVAVVGRVSAGKSTLVNALIGEERVATGSQELTFNVNRLRYGTQPGLTIHYKDGRLPRAYSLDTLESFTVRREEHSDELTGIREIVVETTAPYLKDFELIDTPGLDSKFGTDSLNTLEFLRIDPDEVKASTERQASGADALLLVVPVRGVSKTDTNLLDAFLGSGHADATPLTALGVLTKCEHHWSFGEPHPLEIGRVLADRTLEEGHGMRGRLYDLTPVCSLVGQGAATLDDATLEHFRTLAKVPLDTLRTRLSSANIFGSEKWDVALARAERNRLWDRFGAFGIHTATGAVRDGIDTVAELREYLLVDSGMAALRTKLVDHFGHRASLLKFRGALDRIRSAPHDLAAGLGPRERSALDAGIGLFEGVSINEPGFAELKVLRNSYGGRLRFSAADTAELRRALGEEGRRPHERLGLPADTPARELVDVARRRHAYWLTRGQSGVLAGADREAARIVVRAYEHLLHDLR